MWNRTGTFVVYATMAVILLPGTGRSQTRAKESSSEMRLERAERVRQQAVQLHSTRPNREVAALHQLSASLRSADDPEAVNCLIVAAHLLDYGKRPIEARATMEAAARRALAMGDVVRAADAYANAAFLARKHKNRPETLRLGKQALLLTASPLLTEQQREAVRYRIRTSIPLSVLTQ